MRFQVVSEGERGLLGVGYAPARVRRRGRRHDAAVRAPPERRERRRRRACASCVERFAAALGVPCRVEVDEDEETIVATCTGRDLGLLIGKHGQTIDAIQYLANAIVHRAGEDAPRKSIVVDAAGYRAAAPVDARVARRPGGRAGASGTGSAVELEPMTAVERKVVHLRLKDFDGVETTSEGAEPNRYVVVTRPAVSDELLERWLAALVARPA